MPVGDRWAIVSIEQVIVEKARWRTTGHSSDDESRLMRSSWIGKTWCAWKKSGRKWNYHVANTRTLNLAELRSEVVCKPPEECLMRRSSGVARFGEGLVVFENHRLKHEMRQAKRSKLSQKT